MFTLINDVPLLGSKAEFYSDSRKVQLFPGDNFTGFHVGYKGHTVMPTIFGNNDVFEFGDYVGMETLGNRLHISTRGSKRLKMFENIEAAGTNISYRCVDCRNCLECKKGNKIEEISIQEEVEQSVINKYYCGFSKKDLWHDCHLLKMTRKVYNNQE